MSKTDLIPSTSMTKLDLDYGHWEFKLRAQQWFDQLSSTSGNVEHGLSNLEINSNASTGQMVSLVDMTTVSMPGSSAEFSRVLGKKIKAPPGLDQAPVTWTSSSQCPIPSVLSGSHRCSL